MGEIRDFFLHEARAIQQGGPEYVYSAEWLGIYWPHDEYIFIKMTAEGRLDDFYREAGALLNDAAAAQRLERGQVELLAEAVRVNHVLVNQPFADADLVVETDQQSAGILPGGPQRRGHPFTPQAEHDPHQPARAKPRRFPDVVPRDRLVGKQERRIPLRPCAGAVSLELAGHY